MFSMLAYVNFTKFFTVEFDASLLAMPILLGTLIAILVTKLEKRNNDYAKQLEKLSAMLANLTSFETSNLNVRGVAHDLNNLLGPVCATAEILQMPDYPADNMKLGADLESVFEKLRVLLKRLVDETTSRTHRPARVNLASAVGGITPALSLNASALGHELIVADVDKNITGRIDALDMDQIILNLVMNAIQAANRHLLIKIQIIENEDSWILVVEDNGDGIHESVRTSLFELGVSGRAGGTGVGLALVKELVTRNGGKVSLTTGENGTRFEIQFSNSDLEAE